MNHARLLFCMNFSPLGLFTIINLLSDNHVGIFILALALPYNLGQLFCCSLEKDGKISHVPLL